MDKFINSTYFYYQKSTKMHYEHFEDKRKQKKKYLRLKIITNRDFNFITAVRPDSTVTDLANRALNAYLQLSQENRSKKQLTVSAVKQGRYFMPKSEIVSNLLTQDEEVEIIIVKAKPKFPEQHIPTHHDFQILTKKIKNFDESISKKPSSISSMINMQSQMMKTRSKLLQTNNLSKSSSENSMDGSILSSKSSQLQHSKRQRKKEKRQQKKLKYLQNSLQQKNVALQEKSCQKKVQKIQTSQRKAQKMQGQINTFENKQPLVNEFLQDKIIEHKSLDAQPNQQNLSLFHCRSVDRSVQKQNGSKTNLRFPQPSKRDFTNTFRQTSQQKIDQAKKKHKAEKHQNEEVSRKGSVDNRSQKTPKINPIQSPKIVFHFQTKHESPKVIYIPESKTISEMKQNIEKEKEKLKTMSPLILPKSSPKISLLQDPTERMAQNNRILLGIPNKKGSQRKSSIQNEQELNEFKKEKEIQKIDLEPSPKISNLPVVSVQQRRPTIMQPEIIEEQSSQEQIVYSFMKLPNQKAVFNNSQKSKKQNSNQKRALQQNESTIKKKSNPSSKFFEIENLINKFKLEQSDDENC